MPMKPAMLLIAAALAVAPPAWAAGPATPTAAAAAIYDPATQGFLLARRAGLHLPVASLVKLMTARLAIEADEPSLSLSVPSAVTLLPQTKVGLVPGQRVTMATLISAMLIHSGNDAAVTVAVALGGSEAGFAGQMNAAAAAIGLTQTHYVDSTGLDAPGQYSSAHDVALLAAADLGLPGFAAIVDQPDVVVGGVTYRSVNPFLAYYPAATGIKTGFTSEAMFCLAASATRSGETLIAVVLGEPSWAAADADAASLLDWGFAQSPAAAVPAAAPAGS